MASAGKSPRQATLTASSLSSKGNKKRSVRMRSEAAINKVTNQERDSLGRSRVSEITRVSSALASVEAE